MKDPDNRNQDRFFFECRKSGFAQLVSISGDLIKVPIKGEWRIRIKEVDAVA